MTDTGGKVVVFNPLDKRHLGESVGQAMLRQPAYPMAALEEHPFIGAGIYAIYYSGDFPAYEEVAKRNRNGSFMAPIYVGKAVPPGARKGGALDTPHSKDLFKRLKEHAKTIRSAVNLNIDDFHYRYLVVDDIWIPLGETLLIAKFNPVWNVIVDGFGNHDPGKGRYKGMRPRWDVLHPGRSWADNLADRDETADQIITEVREYLRNNPPPDDVTMITI